MNKSENEFFDELMQQVSLIEKSRALNGGGGCARPGSGGDCMHYIGLPGKSIPGQHDGEDDTVDAYDKPNGWCWSCWKSCQIDNLRKEVQALEAWQDVAAESNRNVSAYLQKRFPSLELDEGMPITKIYRVVEHLEKEMTASEALFGFMAWLTTRDEAVTFSGHHLTPPAVELVSLFCEVNGFAEPRNGWDKKLIHPKECRPDGSTVMGGITEKDRPPSPWRPHLEEILSKLSGDINHNNIAEAKDALKSLIDL